MKITIFGMGYVGVVSAACLLRDGHEVKGIDLDTSKVDDLAEGRTPIQEPGVAELLADGHRAGLLSATVEPDIGECDMMWICVGTPSGAGGQINLSSVQAAAKQIGESLRKTDARPLIVLRSTVLPGTTSEKVVPLLEKASGLQVGTGVHVVFHPEFLREGSAIDDFDHPPKIVVGEAHVGAAVRLMSVYENIKAPRFHLNLAEAELVKYYDNLFHAMKVTFANEMGAVARSVDVDARKVADVFRADTKLNISPRYLRPGFAFGGSCLGKDLRAIVRCASESAAPVPMLDAMLRSNQMQISTFVMRILEYKPETVGIVGLAFKPYTDDLRESPYVEVAKRLIGEGMVLQIYDPGVQPSRLIGSNKQAVQRALAHVEKLLVESLDDLDGSDLILVNHQSIDAARINHWLKSGTRVIDLAGVDGIDRATENYEGIFW